MSREPITANLALDETLMKRNSESKQKAATTFVVVE